MIFLIRVKGIKVICGDVAKLPFKDNFFDVVTAVAVFEHLLEEDLNKIIEEITRVLKLGGVLLVEVPYKEKLSYNYVLCPDCLTVFHSYQHLRSFDENNICQLSNNRGVKIEGIKPFTPLSIGLNIR